MRRILLTAALLSTCAGAGAAQENQGRAFAPDLGGKLYRSVFNAGAGGLTAADVAALPEPMKTRLGTYLSRRAAFKSSYKNASDSLEMMRTDAKKRALERAMVSLLDAPGIERLAADFVAKAPIAYEWHGIHEGPLAEAGYAEAALKKDPSSPLTPFLYVFVAHRQRVVFETYEAARNEEGMKSAAKAYRTFAARARSFEDPIFAALIDDMERQPYLYIKGTKHPKDS